MEQVKLPKDWEAEVIRATESWGVTTGSASVLLRKLAERCFALASKPLKELTNEEIDQVVRDEGYPPESKNICGLARAIEAAALRKQREPERVKFRAARNKVTRGIDMFIELPHDAWEWLEPAQEYEMKV